MMQNKIIGITGGVGSGKSVVLNYLSDRYGARIIEADRLAEKLMEPGQTVYEAVVAAFSEGILEEKGGRIDRKKLAEIVFHDEYSLKKLNEIVHPLVKEYILNEIDKWNSEGRVCPFVIEAALLIQDGYKAICDVIWYVKVSKEIRIIRLMAGRGYSREKCISIMNNQPEDAFFEASSDLVILNDESIEAVKREIDRQFI